ncbi:MAG: excinuclease ABC subunit UvrA [Deltaproteobacteria bacterium]|nr:excinuclease ABC subunit UvrA [Deltaproteobacteria bacterium]
MKNIIIKGARVHNLKNLNLEIPRDSLVVITGVSGSGKSSLAFDTIYAEGQRRYVESLSAYARQFLEQTEKPELDAIEGLSPAIAIEQKTTSKNPRSTVGTVTEIYDFMRLLFARAGSPYCYKCKKPISSQTSTQMVERVMELKEGTRFEVLAPIVRGRKGEFKKDFESLLRSGYMRVYVDGKLLSLEDEIKLSKKKKHDIDVVIDRLIIKDTVRGRLAESMEVALMLSKGLARVVVLGGEKKKAKPVTLFFNENLACVDCSVSYPELTPTTFSFNSPHGACTECGGIGDSFHFDAELVVPDKNLSLKSGAILPWNKKNSKRNALWFEQVLTSLASHYDFDPNLPFKKLPKKIKDIMLYGSGEEEINFEYKKAKKSYSFQQTFEGVIPNLERRYHDSESEDTRADLERFMNAQRCVECNGARLKKDSLYIKIGKKNIFQITELSITAAIKFFSTLKFEGHKAVVAPRILKEIIERLGFLSSVGLDYLTLARSAATLSGGEGQRIRLATQIGSSLVGVLYILDEPSIGLHQRDNQKLLDALRRLRDMGNSVLVVEHDEATIESADFVIDMGPGAGAKGGEIVAIGTPPQILKNKKSLTGKYLTGELKIPLPKERRKATKKAITLKGLKANNLKNINVSFPLGLITCVTGVSGSGKSTLVIDTLFKNLRRRLYGSRQRAQALSSITGVEHIDKVIDVDQSPIGRTPRSNPATYTGLFTPVRELFSSLPDAKLRGYGSGRFSFNVKGGRCEACRGEGVVKVEMHFLPDVYVHCELCDGRRYNSETLQIRYKGRSIADALEMTVAEALEFFKNVPHIKIKLKTLFDVGLGYIKLGQAATTLSGGEAQRIKLAKELSKRPTGRTLYILDEPTTGLHFADIHKLLEVLRSLSESGNTIIIIEHNLDVIKTADYVIDMGPEGGDKGGKIVAKGTPEEVAKVRGSYTGRFLKQYLKGA